MPKASEQTQFLESRDSSIDSINMEDTQDDEEEIYEKIEAPKFVDFTLPDHYCPDDRYWFCLRVGCDQKHEEELDSEEIYKNFVLRVMAARSPNVRLRKALNRNASSTMIKCPLSAPPKSTKSRIPRLAVVSSISQKIVDKKAKVVRPILKSGSTPKAKAKPVAAKYLTTPRNRKCLPDESSFRSIRNPKTTDLAEGKNKMVAKSLFKSPKKTIKVKTSVELRTPLTKLCEGMKRLEINSRKNPAMGHSGKSLKNAKSNPSSRVEEKTVHSRGIKKEIKSVQSVKSKSKGQVRTQVSKKLKGNETNELNIHGKVRVDPTLASKIDEAKDNKENLAAALEVLQWESTQEPPLEVNSSDFAQSDSVASEGNSKSLSNDAVKNDFEGHKINRLEDSKRGSRRHDSELIEGDDKENASASDGNRILSLNQNQNGRKIFGRHESDGNMTKKASQAMDQKLNDGVVSSETVASGMKLKKLKLTNPKPFKLRTDERSILKEANLERKTNSLLPQNDIQKGSSKLADRKIKGEQAKSRTTVTMTPERCRISALQDPKPCPTLRETANQSSGKTRNFRSSLQQRYHQNRGIASTRQEMASHLMTTGHQLDVIHEIPGPKGSKKLTQQGKTISSKATASAASRGRRPVTIAKEPNFHQTHVPKSCAKKLTVES